MSKTQRWEFCSDGRKWPELSLAPTDYGTRYDDAAITRIRVLFQLLSHPSLQRILIGSVA